MHRRRGMQKRWSKRAVLQSGYHLPSQRESDFYWPTNGASRSRTEVNQYKWLGLSSLPFKIHELLGNKATAERDPCWKRFWSLFFVSRHPWTHSDGWQCPGCIIFKGNNGLVSPHKEQKCQCGDIVPLLNTVEIKSLCWIYALIYAYPSEKSEKDTGAQGEEGDGVVTFGFLLICWWTLPVTLNGRNNNKKKKNSTCAKTRTNHGNVKDKSRGGSTVFAPGSSSQSAAKYQCQSKRVHLEPFQDLQLHFSGLRHTGTTLYFYFGEDCDSWNVLLSPFAHTAPQPDLNPVLTPTATPSLNPQMGLWSFEDRQKCNHFPKMVSLCE